jgi:hypothetical protein
MLQIVQFLITVSTYDINIVSGVSCTPCLHAIGCHFAYTFVAISDFKTSDDGLNWKQGLFNTELYASHQATDGHHYLTIKY